ncbi:DUF5789 family protein [Haloarchaeobius amylolyticus]|uniref:DUF5789 family protein n=1 Tax=Haloarchaeobius amylolyticus TaxID=1198296 RepID=UPI00226F0C4B|nr:hypothetical protein [Haloarchaeobius amylolyticus]
MTETPSDAPGIDMHDLDGTLADESFPLEKSRLLDEYGDHEVSFANGGSTTLDDVLSPAGIETFEDVQGIREMVVTMVDADAIGEKGQTGRGTASDAALDERAAMDEAAESESL